MDIQECIHKRRSVRKYLSKEVSNETVSEILDIARLAPSAYNAQNWRFIIVTDREKRKQIADCCSSQHWMTDAPVFIVVCNFHKKLNDMHKEKGMLFSTQDCAIVASYIQLLAVEKGLGTCWIGAFDNDELNRIIHNPALNVPQEVKVEAVLTLGFPDDSKHAAHIRNEAHDFCYFDKWESKDLKKPGFSLKRQVKDKTGFFKDLFSFKVQ